MILYINIRASLVVVFSHCRKLNEISFSNINSEGIDKEVLNTFPSLGIEAENCCLLLLKGALPLQCLFEKIPSTFILKRKDVIAEISFSHSHSFLMLWLQLT